MHFGRFITSTILLVAKYFSDKKNVIQPFQENYNNYRDDFGQ